MLSLGKRPALITGVAARSVHAAVSPVPRRCRIPAQPSPQPAWKIPASEVATPKDEIRLFTELRPVDQPQPAKIDPFYLFGCYVEWERHEDPSAGWELIAATESLDDDTRAHACALLGESRHFEAAGSGSCAESPPLEAWPVAEDEMNTPYGLEIIEDCAECTSTQPEFFCGFSHNMLRALNQASHKSTLPAGAILFVEGQVARGVFIVCSGKVNLSASSREGKTLILKTASAGEALGLSSTISGVGYETTAETAVPSQVNFIDRKHFLELMESYSETGMRTAQCLSRDYQTAYHDIHKLVLTRSSAGKLARLLLSQSPTQDLECETRVHVPMTHEEMAQRIGASRETVTRLLTRLRKKKLIRLDGPTLVIRDRTGLEELAV